MTKLSNSSTSGLAAKKVTGAPPRAEAAPGWIGSSQQALSELVARWEARHSHHKLQVGGLGSHVADAMTRYASNEEESAQAVRSLRE